MKNADIILQHRRVGASLTAVTGVEPELGNYREVFDVEARTAKELGQPYQFPARVIGAQNGELSVPSKRLTVPEGHDGFGMPVADPTFLENYDQVCRGITALGLIGYDEVRIAQDREWSKATAGAIRNLARFGLNFARFYDKGRVAKYPDEVNFLTVVKSSLGWRRAKRQATTAR